MKGIFSSIFILISSWCLAGLGPVPVVPSNIEIAGIKLKLTNDAREEIQKDVNALRASDKYFKIKLDRVNLYFPIIERVLKEEGVPEELKYLAVQESSLESDAVSTSDAVGYWQFKDFTAREVGLRVDGKVDERKNIVSATRGAAKYFKRNNFYFKNWILSVSAYQAGPAGAKKYVRDDQIGADKLTITSRSHWYVLRFIAHVIAFSDEVGGPHSEGLKLAEYTKGAGKSISDIAKEVKADKELLEEYNKWLSHGKIPDDKNYTVIIPIQGKIPKELQQSDDPPPLTRSIPQAEPVKYPDELTASFGRTNKTIFIKINGIEAVMAGAGDNIVELAKKADIGQDKLMKFNDLNHGRGITAGEIYYTKRKKNRSPIRFHVAQFDESLWEISQKYGVKLKKLRKKNRMEEGEVLKPGRLLWLHKKRPKKTPIEYHEVSRPIQKKQVTTTPTPKKKTPEPVVDTEEPTKTVLVEEQKKPIATSASTENKRTHEVQPGETLWAISRKYNVSVDDLINWNGLATGSLSVGQVLFILAEPDAEISDTLDRISATKEEPEPPAEAELGKTVTEQPDEINNTNTPKYHEVVSGESLWGISRTYGVTVDQISKWNDLENGVIHEGQQLLVSNHSQTQKANADEKEPQIQPKEQSTPDIHVVQAGESLWAISRKYDVSVDDLIAWNGLTGAAAIHEGEKLLIKSPPAVKPKSSSKYQTYTVKGGDSLYKIAQSHNMTVDELMKINDLSDANLAVGQILKVQKR